jgi:hypothetical protein
MTETLRCDQCQKIGARPNMWWQVERADSIVITGEPPVFHFCSEGCVAVFFFKKYEEESAKKASKKVESV